MKTLKSTIALFAMLAVVWSCGSNSKTVETSEAEDVQVTEDAVSISVNTDNSVVTWIGSKPAGKHNGTIAVAGGEVLVQNDAVVGGSFDIDINSLVVLDLPADSEWNGKLRGHLMSADFFDAENYPAARFEITGAVPFASAEVAADKEEFQTEYAPATLSEVMVENPTHFISGNLTMRGVTKNITFPASVSLENGVVRAKANFNINRTDWNLKYQDESSVADKAADQFIYNTVNVGFELEAGTASAAM
jgi:polyisoprenoid-binding protein YceI